MSTLTNHNEIKDYVRSIVGRCKNVKRYVINNITYTNKRDFGYALLDLLSTDENTTVKGVAIDNKCVFLDTMKYQADYVFDDATELELLTNFKPLQTSTNTFGETRGYGQGRYMGD